MTRDELRLLCESQIAQCETWTEWKREKPHGKFYEACKSTLELLDENKLLVETLNDVHAREVSGLTNHTQVIVGLNLLLLNILVVARKPFLIVTN